MYQVKQTLNKTQIRFFICATPWKHTFPHHRPHTSMMWRSSYSPLGGSVCISSNLFCLFFSLYLWLCHRENTQFTCAGEHLSCSCHKSDTPFPPQSPFLHLLCFEIMKRKKMKAFISAMSKSAATWFNTTEHYWIMWSDRSTQNCFYFRLRCMWAKGIFLRVQYLSKPFIQSESSHRSSFPFLGESICPTSFLAVPVGATRSKLHVGLVNKQFGVQISHVIPYPVPRHGGRVRSTS